MCGITGIFDTRGRRADRPRELCARMNESQHHRGPDEGGLHVEPGVGLGHRRLSIIDLATGQQPLFNEDGRSCVVFNGEIYNYQELMPELQALGHVFRTRATPRSSSTPGKHGARTASSASAACSRSRCGTATAQTLFLARDRLGVKPLYYALLDDGTLLFGSELKSLLAHGGAARATSTRCAVEEYFALGYVAEPRTIFRRARKLPPAHTLAVRRGAAARRAARVLGRALHARQPRSATREALRRAASSGCDESVRLRMISEVPLGAFLSGGVDSSAVVAMMAGCQRRAGQHLLDRLRRPGLRRDRAFAQQVADRYRTRHYVETVRQRRLRPDRHARARCTTSPTPTARRSRPTASASSRASTSPWRCRATAATRASAATAATACT